MTPYDRWRRERGCIGLNDATFPVFRQWHLRSAFDVSLVLLLLLGQSCLSIARFALSWWDIVVVLWLSRYLFDQALSLLDDSYPTLVGMKKHTCIACEEQIKATLCVRSMTTKKCNNAISSPDVCKWCGVGKRRRYGWSYAFESVTVNVLLERKRQLYMG